MWLCDHIHNIHCLRHSFFNSPCDNFCHLCDKTYSSSLASVTTLCIHSYPLCDHIQPSVTISTPCVTISTPCVSCPLPLSPPVPSGSGDQRPGLGPGSNQSDCVNTFLSRVCQLIGQIGTCGPDKLTPASITSSPHPAVINQNTGYQLTTSCLPFIHTHGYSN